MDLSAELKELRKQLYTYRYKSLELERQLRTHCNAFHQSFENGITAEGEPSLPIHAFSDTSSGFLPVFTNGLLVEMIISHLPVQDLLRCRLVCKYWAREMAQYLTKRKALVVAYEDCSEARELIKKKENGKLVNISTLCVLEISITSQIIIDVVQQFGETLSGLKLDDCNPTSKQLYQLLESLPSLEVFSFKQTGVVRRSRLGGDEESNTTSSRLDGLTLFASSLRMLSLKKLIWEEMKPVNNFERIIEMFPSLEELELLCWCKPDINSLRGKRLDTLKHLSISCDNNFSEKNFKALAGLNLKLKKLTLNDIRTGPRGAKEMRGLKLFLESVSQTVVEMSLNGCGRLLEDVGRNEFARQPTPFPIGFPALEKFEIDCSLMTDLKMIDHVPKLQKLEAKFQDWKGWWHLLNRNGAPKPHPELRELSLGSIDSGCLKKITACFESVTKLEVAEDRIDDVAMRVICTMSQLYHLRIIASTSEIKKRLRLTDFGFTGIPLEECQKLLNVPRKKLQEIRKVRKYPYIGNLKNLYSLELACSEIFITDLAVLYGIAELPRISTITLPNCKLTKASLEALTVLPGLLVLELHKSCGISDKEVEAVRDKKKDLVFNLYSDLNARLFF